MMRAAEAHGAKLYRGAVTDLMRGADDGANSRRARSTAKRSKAMPS